MKLRTVFLPEQLPWRVWVGGGVVLNHDGSLQMSFRLGGPDLSAQSDAVRGSRMLQANNAVRRFGRGDSLFVEARRTDVTADEYPVMTHGHPVAQRADRERRAAFMTPGTHFLSAYYLTFRHAAPSRSGTQLESWFVRGESPLNPTSEKVRITQFRSKALHLAGLLGGQQYLTALDESATRTYLKSCVSWKRHRVAAADIKTDLHLRLGQDSDFQCGNLLKLGPYWMYVISITDLPDRSLAGLLTAIDDLAIESRWCTRYIAIPKGRARNIMQSIRRQHYGHRVSWPQRFIKSITGSMSPLQDVDAMNKSESVSQAQQEMGADLTGFGYFTDSIVVWDRDASVAYEKAKIIEEVINDRECSCRIEDVNAEEAWYSTHAGNVSANIQREMESSLNRVHTMPGLLQVWTGTPWDYHLNAPAWFHVTTATSTPFHASAHARQSDASYTFMFGPQGKGKTAMLGKLVMQWTQYQGYFIALMDMKGGLECVTRCLGGIHIDLGKAGPSFQPVGDLDQPHGFRRAMAWLLERLMEHHLPLTAERRGFLSTGLTMLRGLPRQARTLTRLDQAWGEVTGNKLRADLGGLRRAKNEDELRRLTDVCLEIREVFKPFHGGLLDGDHDVFLDASVVCFEWETLLEIPDMIAPTIAYIWPMLQDRFQGQPSLLVVDEFKSIIQHPLVIRMVDKGIRLYRYRNVAFLVATQFAEDVTEHPIGKILLQSGANRLILPNPAALTDEVWPAYKALGLPRELLPQLASAVEKEDYLWMSEEGARFFKMKLEGTELAVCGRGSLTDHRRMDRIFAQYGREHFWEGWLDEEDTSGDRAHDDWVSALAHD